MSIHLVNPVKRAASLLLFRNSSRLNSLFDYQVLLLERKVNLFIT